MNVTASIVTRGDVDLAPVLATLRPFFSDIVIWDNSWMGDMKVYGRYCAIDRAEHPFIYTQDDDCLVQAEKLLSLYQPGQLLVNVPEDEERAWLGWGSIFPSEMPSMFFQMYLEHYPLDDIFMRWADVIFSEMALPTRVDVGHFDLPHAFAENRMNQQPDHESSQAVVRQRCRELLASQSSLPL